VTTTEVRDLFFSTAIPTDRGLTVCCLSAGAALAAFLKAPPRLFRRDEYPFGPKCRQSVRRYLAQILAALPALPGDDGKRRRAIEMLERYDKALA
jgi:hypothetical protein